MFIDSKGKLFGKISIVDILIILVVVIAAAGIGYKFKSSPLLKQDKLEVVLFIEEAPEYTAPAIKVGDSIREVARGGTLGTVTDIQVGDSIAFAANDQGEYVKSSKEGYKSLTITASALGTFSNNGVKFHNADYYIGSSYEFRVGNVALYGKIKSITKKE